MRIACLPLAGPHNPYQNLLKAGLQRAGHEVVPGASGQFFPFIRTVFGKKPAAIHLDWAGSYYLRANPFFCAIQVVFFWVDTLVFSWLNVPLVWTLHNLTEHETKYPALDHWAKRRLARLSKKIRIFAEIQLPEAQKKLGKYGHKIVVVPEGSYVGHYPETQTRQDARFLLGLAENARVVLHFGNLRPYKGSIDLVQAFIAVAGPHDRLVMAGPAHNPAYVKSLQDAIGADKRILLIPGFVEEPRVQTYFMAADLAAFPFARIDNSGTVILAMGFGLVCVAPATGAVAGRLAGQPDFLFLPGQLSAVLQKALTTPAATLQALGQQNRAQVLAHTWDDFATVFASL
jgi:glycosyltransferase involved in cell wall biosynthesis